MHCLTCYPMPRPTLTAQLFPYTTLFRSLRATDLQHEVSATIRRLEGRLKSLASEGNTASNKAIATQIRQRLADLTPRSEEHTSELQSLRHLVCRLLLEKKKKKKKTNIKP